MNFRKFLFIFLSAILLSSCNKVDFDENHHLKDEMQKKLIFKWGQSYNGRWDVYLLLKSMKEAKTPEEINILYNDYLKILDNAQLHYKTEISSRLNMDNLGNLDTLYVKYYDHINRSLEKRTTMDSLWNIYSKMSILQNGSKTNLYLNKRFYIEKPSELKFKNGIDPVDVNVCTIFRQYEEAARLGGIYKYFPNPTCEMSALVAVHDYYTRYNGQNVANDPWSCAIHTQAFSDFDMQYWNCQFETSPTDPYPPGGTGGAGGSSGSVGGSGGQGNKINHNSLDSTQSAEFLEMLDYAKYSCSYRKLIDYLQSIGEVTIKIYSGDNAAFYNATTKEIVYNNGNYLRSTELFTHEGFHAYQHQAIYGSSFSNYHSGQPGYINMEFEQIVFQDISRRIVAGSDGIGTMFNQRNKEGFQDAQDSYTAWIDQLTNNGSTHPNIAGMANFVNEYNQHLTAFKKYGHTKYSNTDIVPSIDPEALKAFFNGDIGTNCSN